MPSAAILHIDISVAVGATKTARTSQPGSTHDRGPRVEDIATLASKAALGVIDMRINQAE